MLETFNAFVTKINGFVWGPVMLILLVGTHVYLTFRTRIIQRKTITAIKLSVTPDSEASGDVSGFGALATALAATIGTGNIVGVATRRRRPRCCILDVAYRSVWYGNKIR